MASAESYQGLARKYRPQTFEDLVGQEAVAQSLASALRQGKVAHGHLMAGPRGVGKTTSARILARALNCVEGPTATPCGVCRHCIDIAAGNDLDVIEIDAASNTSVENIRELRERVIQAPFAARFKVYIIDEVHMLSQGAFNALLKTLEEPPESVVFVLATTELEKVPETIRSRCVVHGFRRISGEDIVRRLAQVAVREGVAPDAGEAREVYGLIARSVEGGMRDALVALDQVLAMTEGVPTVEAATRLLGLADQDSLRQTVAWVASGEGPRLLGLVEELVERGRSLERFVKSLTAYLRELMLLQAGADARLLGLTGDTLAAARKQADELATATLFNMLNQVLELEERLKRSGQGRFLLEFTLLRLAQVRPVVPIDALIERIGRLPEAALQEPARGGAGSGSGAAGGAARPAQSAAAEPSRPAPARRSEGMQMVLLDSTPAADEPAAARVEVAPAQAAPGRVGEKRSGAELMEELLPRLPVYLRRYLPQAAGIELEGGVLRIVWSDMEGLGARMLSRGDNVRLIESTLEHHFGREIKLLNLGGGGGGAPAGGATTGSAAGAAEVPGGVARPKAVLRDVAPEDVAETETGEFEGEPAEEEERGPEPMARMNSAPAPRGPGGAEKVTKVADGRGAAEKAREFMRLHPEAERRVKMLSDMFAGRMIDEHGQPLAL